VVKYVSMQLLVLAASLNENLSKIGSPVLPISFDKSPVPQNLPSLMADLASRVSHVTMTSSSVTQGVVPAATTPSTAALPAQTVTPNAIPAVAPVQPAATAPVASQASPVVNSAVPAIVPPTINHPKVRRRRDVSGIVSETADVVGDLASAVSDNTIAQAVGLSDKAEVISTVSDAVEEHFKSPETSLGEMILTPELSRRKRAAPFISDEVRALGCC